jgi:hypothetical protein
MVHFLGPSNTGNDGVRVTISPPPASPLVERPATPPLDTVGPGYPPPGVETPSPSQLQGKSAAEILNAARAQVPLSRQVLGKKKS